MLLSKELLRKGSINPEINFPTIVNPDTRNYMDDTIVNIFEALSNYHEQRLENQKLLLTESKNIKKFIDNSNTSSKGVLSSMKKIINKFYDKIRSIFMSDINYVLANSEYITKFDNSDSFTMEDIYKYSIDKEDTKHLYILFKNLADKVQKVYDDCNKCKKPEDMIKVFQKFYDDNILSSSEEYVRQIRNTILKRGSSAKYIHQYEYIQEINKKFHCGDSKSSNIKIDKKYVEDAYDYLKKAKYNEIYKAVQDDMDTCKEIVDRIVFYINAIYNKTSKYNNSPDTSKVNLSVAIESFCNKIYNSMFCIITEEVNIYVGIELDCMYQMISTYAKILKKIVKDQRSKE
jgi:hypothetical protein